MAVDVYLRIPTDPNYDPSQLEVEDRLENFIQYIEMILTTTKGEVFGDPKFGASLDQYLWNQNISTGVIATDLNNQIMLNCPDSCQDIPYSIEINFYKGNIYDTMVVDIIIDGKKVLGIAATPQNAALQNSFT
jgi:hypothetical protein